MYYEAFAVTDTLRKGGSYGFIFAAAPASELDTKEELLESGSGSASVPETADDDLNDEESDTTPNAPSNDEL
uniref:Uncharacterized protein n=1 Tax=Anopheles dirus TaxID=7168 RepID=A0A182NGI7_9DIPT